MKYPDAIGKIDEMCKQLCQKLYVGENAHYLVGNDKIPVYLSIFLEKMKRQAEEFKINQVRQLRVSAARFQELCAQVPYSVFSYLKTVYCNRIEQEVKDMESDYDKQRAESMDQKEKHLRMFRPNLENPSNKQATADLNEGEIQRSDELKDLIDDVQIGLLDIEQNNSLKFYCAYLNNVRALILLYNNVIYKENFI